MPGSKTSAKNTKARKTTASMATAKKTADKKAIVKTTAKRATTRTPARASGRSGTPVKSTSASAMPARPGDLIVIDSAQVGTPAREGEVTKVIHGELSVRYWVKWGDGHETLISPAAGTAHIFRP